MITICSWVCAIFLWLITIVLFFAYISDENYTKKDMLPFLILLFSISGFLLVY